MSLNPDEDVRTSARGRGISDKNFKGVIALLCQYAPQAALGYVLALLALLVVTTSYRLSDAPAQLLLLFGAGLGLISLAAFGKALGQLDHAPRNFVATPRKANNANNANTARN